VLQSRITKVDMKGKKILSVTDDKDTIYEADVFIDTTGTAGPINNCVKYGNGCASCVLRCASFGGRVSLAGLAGVKEVQGRKVDGSIGAMSGSCKLYKDSLSPELIEKLNTDGVAVVPLPEELIEDHLGIKCCQQYALKEFKNNIILLDTGHAKLMTPFFSIEKLSKISGFENARYEDPYAGGIGNSMRYFAMSPRNNALKVDNIDNLFCGGEKAGLLVGHTEAIVTGVLAGYNAIQYLLGKELLELPRELAIGDAIAFVNEEMSTAQGLGKKYTFSGSYLFDRMKELNLYSTDVDAISEKVETLGLTNVFLNV